MTDHTSPAITAPSDKSNATRIWQRWHVVAIKHIQKNKTENKNTKTIPSVGSSNVCWARVLDKSHTNIDVMVMHGVSQNMCLFADVAVYTACQTGSTSRGAQWT